MASSASVSAKPRVASHLPKAIALAAILFVALGFVFRYVFRYYLNYN